MNIDSIGETQKHTSQLTSDHVKKSHEYIPHTQSATEAAWESAERVEEELKKSNKKGLIVLSKQEKEEEKNERDLLELLDSLNGKTRFALSNNLKYENDLLNKFKDKYKVYSLSGNYVNCNYHKLDRSRDKEVLITNYDQYWRYSKSKNTFR